MITTSRRARLGWNIATYAVLLTLTIFCIFPLVWTLLTSLKYEADIVTQTMQYIPQRITFENYVTIWTQSGFPTLVFNSFIVTATTVVLCLITGTLAA